MIYINSLECVLGTKTLSVFAYTFAIDNIPSTMPEFPPRTGSKANSKPTAQS